MADAPINATRYVLGDPDDRWSITLRYWGSGLWSIHNGQYERAPTKFRNGDSWVWATRLSYDEAVRIAQQLHAEREADRG